MMKGENSRVLLREGSREVGSLTTMEETETAIGDVKGNTKRIRR